MLNIIGFRLGFRGVDTQYDKREPLYGDACEVIGNIYETPDLLASQPSTKETE